MRQRTKLDRNHRQIVMALRSVGATTHSLATVGHGCPDLVVGVCRNGQNFNYLLEIKNPLNPQAALTPCQVRWIEAWQGQVAVVVTPEQALLAIGCTPQEIQAYETASMLRRRRFREVTESGRLKPVKTAKRKSP
jgi:hypothetical protein